MNKNKLTENEILQSLKHKPKADPAWLARTEQNLKEIMLADVTTSANERKSQSNLIFNLTAMLNKKVMLVVATLLLGVGVFGGGFVIYRLSNNQRSVALSAAEQREILAKVLSNNSSAAISSPSNLYAAEDSTLSARVASGGAESLAADTSMPSPLFFNYPNYKYMYSKVVTTPGAASSRCVALGNGEGYQFESYSYSDGASDSYYKNINLDTNGNLISYSLGKNNASGGEYWEYRGGQFAVKTVYTTVASVGFTEPAPDAISAEQPTTNETAPTEEQIKAYFGENAQIKSIVTENGKDYYQIEYSFPIDCNQEMRLLAADVVGSEANYTNNVVYVSLVDSQNFTVYKTQTYLDSVGDANLVFTTTNTEDFRDTDFGSVANNFNFDYSVEVRTLDTSTLTPDAAEQADKVADQLESLDVDVLLLNNPSLPINGISASNGSYRPEPGWDYYLERAFYPSGAYGDKLYAEATAYLTETGDYITTLFSVDAYNQTDYKFVNFGAYAASYSDEQLLRNQQGQDVTIESQRNLTWTVEGQQIPAIAYTVKMPVPTLRELAATSDLTIYPGTDECVDEDGDCSYTLELVVFTYGDVKYLVTSAEGVDLTSLQFDAYSTNNAADMEFLRNKILELITASMAGFGSSGSEVLR